MTTTYNRAEDVAAELHTRLSAITLANGAETDAGTKVLHGKRVPDRTQMPCIVILEGDDSPNQGPGNTRCAVEQQYVLMAFVPCDVNDPNVAARKAIRDLMRAVFSTNGKADHDWGRKVRHVNYRGRDIAPRADGEAFVLGLIEVSVEFAMDLANP